MSSIGSGVRRCLPVRRVLAGVLGVLLLVGCSQSTGPERIPVEGTVAVGGAVIERGSISFLPTEGHHGPAATAVIENGQFLLNSDNGPCTGPHRIVVKARADTAEASSAPDVPKAAPAERRWELRAVVPKQGPFEYDVSLE